MPNHVFFLLCFISKHIVFAQKHVSQYPVELWQSTLEIVFFNISNKLGLAIIMLKYTDVGETW